MSLVSGPALSHGRRAAVHVGRPDADRERLVLDREQELVKLTAHAARKGSIAQVANSRFEPLERPIDRGFRMLAHRSIDQENQVPCPTILRRTARYGLPLCPFLTVRASIL